MTWNNQNKTTNLVVNLRTKSKVVDKYDPKNRSAKEINDKHKFILSETNS